MKAVDLATAYANRFNRQNPHVSGANLMSEGFNAASDGSQVFAYIEAEGEDLSAACFTFEAYEITAQQAMLLLGCWQKIIREK